MSCGPQYIQFEGYFAESVLSISRIIRDFTDLCTAGATID
jgi:hypothetical protein